MPRIVRVLGLLAWLAAASTAAPAGRELAFPGAEGFGAFAKGGHGGRRIAVVTREDTGREGSLRWALAQKGPRIVEFKVGGLFELNASLKVTEPFLTLDGSTAPEGVTLKDGALQVSETHDVIIRHLRVRPGDEATLGKGRWKTNPRPVKSSDAVSVKDSTDVIIDHVSASWSTDETISVTQSRRVTVQHCIIAEPLGNPALHIENGVPISHAYGAIVQGEDVSYLKNYFACFKIRGPQMSAPPEGWRMRSAAVNNLVAFYENSGTRVKAAKGGSEIVVQNNVYRHPLKREAPDIHIILEKIKSEGGRRREAAETVGRTQVFLAGNLGPRRPQLDSDEWTGVRSELEPALTRQLRRDTPPFALPAVAVLPTAEVEAYVLAHAGATLPRRDAIDERIIHQHRAGTGRVIMSQDDVGGYSLLGRAR